MIINVIISPSSSHKRGSSVDQNQKSRWSYHDHHNDQPLLKGAHTAPDIFALPTNHLHVRHAHPRHPGDRILMILLGSLDTSNSSDTSVNTTQYFRGRGGSLGHLEPIPSKFRGSQVNNTDYGLTQNKTESYSYKKLKNIKRSMKYWLSTIFTKLLK